MHRAGALRLCLLLLFCSPLCGRGEEDCYRFENSINNMAMSGGDGGRVFVASNNSLHQLSRRLALQQWVRTGPRLDGPCAVRQGCCQRWVNTTNVNRILVVDEQRGRLLTCGTVRSGACELCPLSNISRCQQDDKGRVATMDPRASTLAFPVPIGSSTYLLTAVTSMADGSRFVPAGCEKASSYYEVKQTSVLIRSLEGQVNSITFLNFDSEYDQPAFNLPTSNLPPSEEHQFVQGFHLNGSVYISVNAVNASAKVVFASVSSIRQSVLTRVNCSLAGSGPLQVLSSALVLAPGSQSYLAAVLTRHQQPQHNAVCLYELRRFNPLEKIDEPVPQIHVAVEPVHSTPLFSYSGLLSVSAALVENWAVIFLGAEDGRLIKLVLDKNMKVLRPSVLIELHDESPIKHSIMFDKIDPHYFYLLTERTVRWRKVANCTQYSSCEDCLSAQDPYCGWCVHDERCSFSSECQERIWIKFTGQADSCPKVALQPLAIDDTLDKEPHFNVTLKWKLGNVSRQKAEECMLRNTVTDEVICQGSYSTQCLCRLSSKTYLQLKNQMGPVVVEASVQLTSVNVTTRANLHNCFNIHTSRGDKPCSDCVDSGCHWQAAVHKCTAIHNQNTVQACPHVTHVTLGEESPHTDLHIYLKDAELLKKSKLSCVYNGKAELTYPARWINKSMIICRRPTFDNERRIIPVNLIHTNDAKNIIDNPNKITVYSCDDQKPGCAFCTPQKSCTESIVTSIRPDRVASSGRNTLSIVGKRLNIGLRAALLIHGVADHSVARSNVCTIENSTLVKCVLPTAIHGKKTVCLLYDSEEDCTATRTAFLEYVTNTYVTEIHPAVSWLHGGRRMTIRGKNLDVLKQMQVSLSEGQRSWVECSTDQGNWICESPFIQNGIPGNYSVVFRISGSEQQVNLIYHENPVFYNFTKVIDEKQVLITVMRKVDELQLSTSDVKIIVHSNKADPLECNITEVMVDKIKCVLNTTDISISKLEMRIGQYTRNLIIPPTNKYIFFGFLVIPVMLVIFSAIYFWASRQKDKQFSKKLDSQMELLESQFRTQIREGFVELQTEGSDVCLLRDYNSIPFLDYMHFATRIFFPESVNESSETSFVKDLIVTMPQEQSDLNQGFHALYNFLNNERFLVITIHVLEQQRDFTIKDRCRFASFLTVAFHSNLVHLTNVLDQLLKDLMDRSSAQPKLLLRRTETVVEKLLTNWVSLCMYGFLRESVGEPLFKLVSAIKQRINLGPVDAVSGKALYTLNEDWLLWQVTDFKTLKLDVTFQLNTEDDIERDQDSSSRFEVEVLDCDTIGQVKKKIFETFYNKYGYSQRWQMEDIDLKLVKNGEHQRLEDIDQTTLDLEAGMKKLNTIGHYHIANEASLVVIRKREKGSKPDSEWANNLCHLISPQSVSVETPVPEQGKQKFKVKEMYLTKLVSSKVALQSFVENLFRSIWSVHNGKPPIAVRHIFDILQGHASNKKITDPDVLHIWKTNSLPLRFWVNVIKNPQFVFDIEKTPHVDGCLSVIAQAFMDSFSLSSQHLGKHSPTNKVLYARDVPHYKEEVKGYYKYIADLGMVSEEEMENFLTEESQKHQNEFKEKDAMIELGKYIQKYSVQLESGPEGEDLTDMRDAVVQIRQYYVQKSTCSWE
ncbi:plexin-C1 isoform X2 [Rhinoraja longicauda]